MSTRATKGLVATAVIGAASLLGCADIIGADFSRDSSGGGGSMGMSVSAASATATASSTASSTGAGGSDVMDICSKKVGDAVVLIHVFVKPSADESEAEDFVSTRHQSPSLEQGFKTDPIGGFEVYTSKTNLNAPRLLSDCPNSGGHQVQEGFVEGCECLGFVEYAKMGIGLLADHRQLTQLIGKKGDSYLAVEPSKPAANTPNCSAYSKDKMCTLSDYYGPK